MGERLNRGERNALRIFLNFASFEAPSKHPRIGLVSLRSLVLRGLAEEGPPGIFGPVFKLTEKGRGVVVRPSLETEHRQLVDA